MIDMSNREVHRFHIEYVFEGPSHSDPTNAIPKTPRQIADALEACWREVRTELGDRDAKTFGEAVPGENSAIVLTIKTTDSAEIVDAAVSRKIRELRLRATRLAR
jgi:hypothetical protein